MCTACGKEKIRPPLLQVNFQSLLQWVSDGSTFHPWALRQWIFLVSRSPFLLTAWSTLPTNTLKTSWPESNVRFEHARIFSDLYRSPQTFLWPTSLAFSFSTDRDRIQSHRGIENAWSQSLHGISDNTELPKFWRSGSQNFAHPAKISWGHLQLFRARRHLLLDAREPVRSRLHPCARRPSQQNRVESFIWFLSDWYPPCWKMTRHVGTISWTLQL